MAITTVQQGQISQQEFAKLLMMGSGGRIEVAMPLTDDERRDYEIHVRGKYGLALATQVKSTRRIYPNTSKARYLNCRFSVRESRVVNDPWFWYFIAYLDPRLMRFADPVFLVPSTEFHKIAAVTRKRGYCEYRMRASMEPHSRDLWHPYRVETLQLGKRVLEIISELEKQYPRIKSLRLSTAAATPDTLWVHRAA